jgi:hypothetical protein
MVYHNFLGESVMKRLLFAAAVIGLLVTGVGLGQPLRTKAFKKVMTQKLVSSQHALEGIALADFSKIKASADKLAELTNTEEWLAVKTPEYAEHTNDFRAAVAKMAKKAKEKNLDGATLAYMEMTLTCVRCHQYVREVQDVRWDGLRGAARRTPAAP